MIYQLTDCNSGPAAIINAVSCTLDRNEISYDLIRKIINTIPDIPESNGISEHALTYLSAWLNDYADSADIPLSVRYYPGPNSYNILTGMDYRSSCAVTRMLDSRNNNMHYILITGLKITDNTIYFKVFDSDKKSADTDITDEHYNRLIPIDIFASSDRERSKLGMKPLEIIIFERINIKIPDTDT